MGTFINRDIVDNLIANDGYYDGDLDGDPRVVRIVEYTNFAGDTCWGIVWVTEPRRTWKRYDRETVYVREPKVIFSI